MMVSMVVVGCVGPDADLNSAPRMSIFGHCPAPHAALSEPAADKDTETNSPPPPSPPTLPTSPSFESLTAASFTGTLPCRHTRKRHKLPHGHAQSRTITFRACSHRSNAPRCASPRIHTALRTPHAQFPRRSVWMPFLNHRPCIGRSLCLSTLLCGRWLRRARQGV